MKVKFSKSLPKVQMVLFKHADEWILHLTQQQLLLHSVYWIEREYKRLLKCYALTWKGVFKKKKIPVKQIKVNVASIEQNFKDV